MHSIAIAAWGGGAGGKRYTDLHTDVDPVIQTQSNMLKELPDAVFLLLFCLFF